MHNVERKGVYLGDRDQENAEIIVAAGFADSKSAAIRVALMQFAAAVKVRPPLVTATTP